MQIFPPLLSINTVRHLTSWCQIFHLNVFALINWLRQCIIITKNQKDWSCIIFVDHWIDELLYFWVKLFKNVVQLYRFLLLNVLHISWDLGGLYLLLMDRTYSRDEPIIVSKSISCLFVLTPFTAKGFRSCYNYLLTCLCVCVGFTPPAGVQNKIWLLNYFIYKNNDQIIYLMLCSGPPGSHESVSTDRTTAVQGL